MKDLVLKNDTVTLAFRPDIGVSLTRLTVNKGGKKFNVFPETPKELPSSSQAGSFTMAPYSNRIRNALFTFADRSYQLERPEKHAIHGDVRNRSWRTVEVTDHKALFELNSEDFADFNFPFPARYSTSLELTENGFRQILAIENTGRETMPVGGGFHPYFSIAPAGESEEVHLQFSAEERYEAPAELPLPTGKVFKVADRYDYTEAKPLLSGHDDCFRAWDRKAQVRWLKSSLTMTITASPECTHAILYSPEGAGKFAFEPASHSIDCFNLAHAGVASTGMQTVEPSEVFSIWWQVSFDCAL